MRYKNPVRRDPINPAAWGLLNVRYNCTTPPKASNQPINSSILSVEIPGKATAKIPKMVKIIPSNSNKLRF